MAKNLDKINKSLNPRSLKAIALSSLNLGLKEFQTRVFIRGQDINGGNIGEYSTSPFYVPVTKRGKSFASKSGSQIDNTKLKPRGKAKSGYNYKKFKNGNARKSSYFKDGYSEFRKAVQRPNDKVNLSLTDNLRLDCRVLKQPQSGFFVVGIASELSQDKAEGNEERFGKEIFSFNSKEQSIVQKEIERNITKLIEKAFL